MELQRISVIGLGLMGGSLCKALKHANQKLFIRVYNRNVHVAKQAKDEGFADEITETFDPAWLCDADLVVICLPVDVTLSVMKQLAPFAQGTVVTDMGSTKASMMQQATKLQQQYPQFSFVGGHPMAGKEKFGYVAAQADLYQNANYVLCTDNIQNRAYQVVLEMVNLIGAHPIHLDCVAHDEALVYASHLPHVIASALACLASRQNKQGVVEKLAAGGFRDTTRIAASSEVMWRAILLDNREAVLQGIAAFKNELETYEQAIRHEDAKALEQLFVKGRLFREKL